MSDKPKVGFIGVGPMGHGMAKNILAGGYPLWVNSLGATEAKSASEMAEACDIIHLCLSNSPQIEAIIRGKDGILASGKSGLIVIDTSTADPVSTMALSAELDAAGMAMVDAPLGRTPKEAEAGTLDAMVGAAPDIFETARPVIECWAGNINHVGPVGSGHKMKLIMNFIALGYAALYSEALALGAKTGVPPQTVGTVIGGSRLSNGFFETFMKYGVGRDENAHVFSIANAAKDVGYVANMASDAEVVNIMGAAIKHYFTHALATGQSERYVPMLSDIVGEMNGLDMAQEVKKGET